MSIVDIAPAAVVLPLLAAGASFTLYKHPNAQRLINHILLS